MTDHLNYRHIHVSNNSVDPDDAEDRLVFYELNLEHAQAEANIGLGRIALSLCATTRPLHAGFANIFGVSVSEAAMRTNPRPTWRSQMPHMSTSTG